MLSFEEFFHEHYESVRRSLAVALADPSLAEELAEDAFARAFTKWRRVSQMEHPTGWVYVVALNAGRRGRRRRDLPIESELETAPDISDEVLQHLELASLIARLPDRQRIAIVLRFLVDLPITQVAQAMGCATGTVKSTLHAALTHLGVDLRDQEELSDADR